MKKAEVGDLISYNDYTNRKRYGVVLIVRFTDQYHCVADWPLSPEEAITKARTFVEAHGIPKTPIVGKMTWIQETDCGFCVEKQNVLNENMTHQLEKTPKPKYLSPFSGKWV